MLTFGIIGVSAVVIVVYLFGFISDDLENDRLNEERILEKFDGYQWSWRCFTIMNNYTLWREHIYKVEKNGDFWVIEGFSSQRDDATKSISSDEAGTILVVYDEINDIVTDWLHGEELPDSTEINGDGKVTNPTDVVYC